MSRFIVNLDLLKRGSVIAAASLVFPVKKASRQMNTHVTSDSTPRKAPHRYFFSRNGLDVGPCSAKELKEQVLQAQLTREDLVWRLRYTREATGGCMLPWLFPPSKMSGSGDSVDAGGGSLSGRTRAVGQPSPRLAIARKRADAEVSGLTIVETPDSTNSLSEEMKLFLWDSATITVQFVGRVVELLKRMLDGKGALAEVFVLWPKESEKSVRLVFGIGTCLLIIGLSRFMSSAVSNMKHLAQTAFVQQDVIQAASQRVASVESDVPQKSLSRLREEREKKASEVETQCRQLIAKGNGLLKAGKLHAAKSTMEQAVKLYPMAVDGHLGLADVFFRMDEPSDGISSLQRAYSQAKGDKTLQLDLLTRISQHCSDTQNYSAAVDAMNKAIELEPEEAPIALLLASPASEANSIKRQSTILRQP